MINLFSLFSLFKIISPLLFLRFLIYFLYISWCIHYLLLWLVEIDYCLLFCDINWDIIYCLLLWYVYNYIHAYSLSHIRSPRRLTLRTVWAPAIGHRAYDDIFLCSIVYIIYLSPPFLSLLHTVNKNNIYIPTISFISLKRVIII